MSLILMTTLFYKSSDITRRNLTLITLGALRVKESGHLRKPNNTAPKYSDNGACLSHSDSCLAPVLSVLSVDKNRLDESQIRLCYGHVFLRKSGKGVCLITVSKS